MWATGFRVAESCDTGIEDPTIVDPPPIPTQESALSPSLQDITGLKVGHYIVELHVVTCFR